jgi:cold shock CspA family protein
MAAAAQRPRVSHADLRRDVGTLTFFYRKHGWGLIDLDGVSFYVHRNELLCDVELLKSGQPVEFSWIVSEKATPPRRPHAYDVELLRR